MFRVLLLSVLLCVVVPMFAMPERAMAADEKILDATIDRYKEEAAKWEPRIKQAAEYLFWTLATVSMVFTFAFMFARGNTGLGDFFGEFLRFIVTIGFFYWLLDNGSAIASAIIKSFAQLGLEASSTYQADLSPSNLISFALDLIVRSCGSFGEQDIATSVIALLLSIAIAVLFAIIASMMVLLLCSAWVLVYAGVIYLGFGGGKWTSDIAVNYFKTVLGLGIQTFVFCLLVGIGQGQIERLISDSQTTKSVIVKGYVYNSTISTTTMTITEGCIILIFTVVLFMLVKTIPQMVAGVISGSSTGGINVGGGSGSLAAAAAVASGGAMIAMQAAGAGLALNSAYQQTKENKANNEGLFKGGGGGSGLAGALRAAGDFAMNLASGASGTAKEDLQKTTTGGGVSANIDASREESKKEREASKAASAAEEGGGMADNGGNQAGNANGGESQGGDGGGNSTEGNGGASASGGEGAQAASGGSSGDGGDALDWSGSISGSMGDSAKDEWQAAIDSYDPRKIGLPDN